MTHVSRLPVSLRRTASIVAACGLLLALPGRAVAAEGSAGYQAGYVMGQITAYVVVLLIVVAVIRACIRKATRSQGSGASKPPPLPPTS